MFTHCSNLTTNGYIKLSNVVLTCKGFFFNTFELFGLLFGIILLLTPNVDKTCSNFNYLNAYLQVKLQAGVKGLSPAEVKFPKPVFSPLIGCNYAWSSN